MQRSGLDISTVRNPNTGLSEVVLIAEEVFDAQRVNRALQQALRPATRAQLAQWLAALYAITISRARDDVDQGLVVAIYCDRLSAFPADIVEHVMLRERWKFFPTIAELEEAAEAHMGRRRLVAQLLEQGRIRHRHEIDAQRNAEPPRELVTPEAHRRIMAEVFGDKAASMHLAEDIVAGVARERKVNDG